MEKPAFTPVMADIAVEVLGLLHEHGLTVSEGLNVCAKVIHNLVELAEHKDAA